MELIQFTSVEQLRQVLAENDARRDAELSWPEDIKVMKDIPYGPDPHWNLLDICFPESQHMKLSPVIVSIHGGGWVYGDKELYSYYCAEMAKYGFAVINFNYRLGPEAPYPAAMEDIITLFDWLKVNAYEYGLDIKNVFALGDSAGAQLLSQYIALCQAPAMRQLPTLKRIAKDALVPRAVALNCGCYNMVPGLLARERQLESKSYIPEVTDEIIESLGIYEYLTTNFPPAFIMTGLHDFLRDEAQPLFEALSSLGCTAILKDYGTLADPVPGEMEYGHVFHLQLRRPEAQQVHRDEAMFFKMYMN